MSIERRAEVVVRRNFAGCNQVDEFPKVRFASFLLHGLTPLRAVRSFLLLVAVPEVPVFLAHGVGSAVVVVAWSAQQGESLTRIHPGPPVPHPPGHRSPTCSGCPVRSWSGWLF